MKIMKIVVPIDFTENTHKLVEYARYIAITFGATIDFLHVIPSYPGDVMIGSPFAQDYQDRDMKISKAKMDSIVNSFKEDFPTCTGKVVYGDIIEGVVSFSKSKEADLLIVGTHGAEGLERLILGNKAEHVLRKAHCPVLVVNPYEI